MRLFITLVFFISVTIIPLSVYAGSAKTIDELTANYSVDQCEDCHEEIHDEWKESWHGKSVIDSRVLRTWRTFILRGLDKSKGSRKDLKEMCLPCHAPVIKDASDELVVHIADLIVTAVDDGDKVKREDAIDELSKLNINCLDCHNMKAVPGGKAQPKTIYSTRDDIDTKLHKEEMGFETVKSDYLKKAEFCAECHHGCPPDMPSSICPTLWTNYKEKYVAHGGDQTCQDCHMKIAHSNMTEEGYRAEYKNHRFPGIYEVDTAKEGIELTLDAAPVNYIDHLENTMVPAVVMNIQVKNTAGHSIPYG